MVIDREKGRLDLLPDRQENAEDDETCITVDGSCKGHAVTPGLSKSYAASSNKELKLLRFILYTTSMS
jgi:hypothetical protein